MSKRRQVQPRVESLETLALMAAGALAPLPGLAAAASGLGSIGSASVNDAVALQQDGSGGSVEESISEIEATYGRRANVRAYAQQVIANHGVTNYDLQNVAGQVGVSLSPGVALPTDTSVVQKVLAAVRGGNLDRVYLQQMKQINAQDVASDQALIQSTAIASIRQYAQETAAYDQDHLDGATQLLQRPRSTYTPSQSPTTLTGTTGAGSQGTASAADAQALQMDASGNALELFISQVEAQKGQRPDATQYAQTVVADHQTTIYDLQATAIGTGVTLPSGITDPTDIQDAKKVLAASRGGRLDAVYLQVMEQVNSQDITADQQLAAATANARIRAYAQETESYDQIHLTGAQTLLASKSTTYVPTSTGSTGGGSTGSGSTGSGSGTGSNG